MATLKLSICLWNYDRTNPMIDGRIAIEGCDPSFTILSPPEAFSRTYTTAEFDVTELSFSNYMTALSENRSPYTAIPVFPSRTFRHGSIFTRTDRGITTPRDLEGKTIGLVEYDMTAAVIVRGLLRDEYGIDTTRIRWRVGDGEAPMRDPIPLPRVSKSVDIAAVPKGQLLNAMLADGELDALIGIEPPSCFTLGHPEVARLFPDWRTAEQAYFAKTGLFPIMHAVGIRTSILDANRWLAMALYRAFEDAKAIALAELAVMNAPKITLPWVTAELSATHAAMGEDYWPYGIDANRAMIETLTRYSLEDGLSDPRLTIEQLFATETLAL